MNIEKIANIIKTKRKEKGITQEELAKRIGVTEKAISRWETGRGTPDISLLIPLSKELGISVSEILNGKEDLKEDKNIQNIVNYIDISKKKKNKFVIPIAFSIYVILLLLYLWYLRVDYNVGSIYHITYTGELIYNAIFMISVFMTNKFIANNYYDTITERNKMNKISYIIIIVIYLVMFFNLTIFKRELYGYSYNLIPFKTISWYFSFKTNLREFLINVIGNIIIMMPVQFLLMKIFNIKKFSVSILVSFVLILLIEVIQLISHTGIFDIDDIILNVFGMSMIFFLVRKRV